MLDDGIRPIATQEQDQTLAPLHAAAYNGHLECVKLLIEKGKVDVNHRDDVGGTPLMRAAWGGHAEIVEWLLEHCADPTVRQPSDVDALEFGAGSGNLDVIPSYPGSSSQRKSQGHAESSRSGCREWQ